MWKWLVLSAWLSWLVNLLKHETVWEGIRMNRESWKKTQIFFCLIAFIVTSTKPVVLLLQIPNGCLNHALCSWKYDLLLFFWVLHMRILGCKCSCNIKEALPCLLGCLCWFKFNFWFSFFIFSVLESSGSQELCSKYD